MQSAQGVWLDRLRVATHYNQWVFSQIHPYLKGQVLEVGCGSGNFTELIAPVCPQLVAVDLNEGFVKAAIDRLKPYTHVDIFAADATVHSWSQSFDTIIMLDVLEHIADDVTLLQQLSQSLAPNGRLILKVPAIVALHNSIDQAVGHYRRYTPERLRTVLTQASFMNSTIWYFNMAGILGWWFNGAVLGRVMPPHHQIGWFDRCVPFLRVVESKVRCPFGLSLFVVATRSSL